MLFKVDENLHSDMAAQLQQHGHDALTVYDQGLRGHPDLDVAAACRRESWAILTLGLDFAGMRAFPPSDYAGIIVLRVSDQSRPSVLQIVQIVLDALSHEPLAGYLWIVDETQIRIRGSS
jgi:predicted nuclease of predicted toxin-antitoxin system